MDWIKKHSDTAVTLGALVGAVVWMTSSMHSVENRVNQKIAAVERGVNQKISEVSERIYVVDKRLTVIETVMIMQGHNVKGIAVNESKKG